MHYTIRNETRFSNPVPWQSLYWFLPSMCHQDPFSLLKWQLAIYGCCLYYSMEQHLSLFYKLTPSFFEYPADTE